jgi:prepilin-type N-terminal cleavage/methylation domain-containing protein
VFLKQRGDGFVLMEVLLAATVLSVGAALYYQVLSNAVRGAGLADRRYRAALLLKKQVCEIEILGHSVSPVDIADDFDLGPVSWTIEEKSDLESKIKTWQVQLHWTNRNQPESLMLEAIP